MGPGLNCTERVSKLNADQLRIYSGFKSHLLHQKQHKEKGCECKKFKRKKLFVSGVGGTEKSFLIEAIKGLVASIWPSEEFICAVAAPTGLAACNMNSVTMHQLFSLPMEHDSYLLVPRDGDPEGDEDESEEHQVDHRGRGVHGVQSQPGLHAPEAGGAVWGQRVVWVVQHALCG